MSSNSLSLFHRLAKLRASHPQPNLVRGAEDKRNWLDLNGSWHFAFDDPKTAHIKQSWIEGGLVKTAEEDVRQIQVPFAYQTELSGINDTSTHEKVWYSRRIAITDLAELLDGQDPASQKWLLHFGAVDYESHVYVNGSRVAHHIGGHVGFSASITNEVQHCLRHNKDVVVTVEVADAPHDLHQPRGKQYWKTDEQGKAAPESIFYTPTTGIWQSVWLEAVPILNVSHVAITPDIDAGTVRVDVEVDEIPTGSVTTWVTVESSLAGHRGGFTTARVSEENRTCSLVLNVRAGGAHPPADIRKSLFTEGVLPPEVNRDAWDNGLALWSPGHPTLYDLEIRLESRDEDETAVLDRVYTYFGMRKVSIDERGRLCLNNRPYFQKLLLDQGYWLGSGLTPPDAKAFEVDILKAKELGFNGVRKHQKVEDPRFLYEADRLGWLVWSEMANAYEFSPKYAARFVTEWMEVVRRDVSHPCIVAWVPVNESWGVPALNISQQQRAHLVSLYHLTKSLDPTRPVIDNDGWQHVHTDLTTIHDYRSSSQLSEASYSSLASALTTKVSGYPIFVSTPATFPSPSLSSSGAGVGTDGTDKLPVLVTEFGGLAVRGGAKGWGYNEAADAEAFLEEFDKLVHALTRGGLVQGFCYTQLADVEQEVNGLLTADRKHKLDPKRVRAILDAVKPVL